MLRIALPVLAIALLTSPLSARDSLGVYSNWGAFRDDSPLRCYAIAKPSGNSEASAFASIANWPSRNVRGQVHIRLSRSAGEDTRVSLSVSGQSFTLSANGRNAWAQNAQEDAAIIAALRSASTMRVSARDAQGRRFADRYDLSGAATAIDAAAVGCAGRG